MRSMFTAVAATALMVGVSLPAEAAWQCVGPSYVCGGAKSVSKAGGYKANRSKAATYKKSSKKVRSAKRSSTKKARSYSSAGSSGGYTLTGKASYYWQPQRVASGGWFNPNALTAAHKTLPFGTRVRVTNRINGKSVVVRINDRGPYIKGRIIDLSKAAAQAISMTGAGVVPVSVAVLGRG